MGELGKLPPELVIYVVSFLGCRDVAALSQTCRRLRELTHVDTVWQRLCEDYKLTSLDGWGENATFREVYSKVLHSYGKFLGLWRNSEILYGILVHVKIEPGQLVARLCQYPVTEDVRDPLLWYSPLFTVTLRDGAAQVNCQRRCYTSHLQIKDGFLDFACGCQSLSEGLGMNDLFNRWMEQSRGPRFRFSFTHMFGYKEGTLIKFTNCWSKFQLQRMVLATASCVSPITLGLYKGTYGGHGIELIHLVAADNGYELLGDKILGDPNVPAGKISLYVDLRQPLTLTREEQDSTSVDELRPETLEAPFRFPPEASQPFALSSDVHERDDHQLPATCKARYGGKGQIAAHGFSSPDFCRGHFVVFSETSFGFYWIDLRSFSLYKLVEEDLS